MTFETVLENRIAAVKDILDEKAIQYQRGNNRYSNFDKIALFENKTPEQALWGIAMKHIAALSDYVNDLPNNDMSEEQWQEKIGDTINYLILLEGIVLRRKHQAIQQ
jgi:hypothetical protein